MTSRLTLFLILSGILAACNPSNSDKPQKQPITDSLEKATPAYSPNYIYGFNEDSIHIFRSTIKRNDYLGKVLHNQGVDYTIIEKLTEKAKGVFNVRKFQAGKNYSIISDKDSIPRYFVYEPNKTEYVIFDFSDADAVSVTKHQKDIELRYKTLSGSIESSLYKTIKAQGSDPFLAILLADIYAWSIDFYRIQKGDNFKVHFTEKFVEDNPVGFGRIDYAVFTHEGVPYYAIYFEQDSIGDYFDSEANSLRKAFLKAPVKFSRISSRYSLRRFHPVLKRNKAHLGTDYAAPYGTPIQATGDGKVIESGYKGGNGNYVKIKHNGTYTTQYLHMSEIAAGMTPGRFVKQGEVIGFVGSTGLATGPHVCYRFWKNGRQVDHLKEKMPPSEPVAANHLQRFNHLRDSVLSALQ